MRGESGVPDDVLALLVCPHCKGPLEEAPDELRCSRDGRRYPVVEGVPWLTDEDRLRKPR